MNRRILIISVIILAFALMLCGCGKKALEEAPSPVAVEAPATADPAATISPESAGIDAASVPNGVYIVNGPADAGGDPYAGEGTQSSSSGSTSSSNVSTPDGVYIVDAPADANANAGGNSGIYIVDPPTENGGNNSGIYIVDPPNGGGGGGGESYGKTIASGSFSSSTGTNLNITTSYVATTVDSSTVRVSVSATLSHSALSANSNSVSFSLGGQSKSRTAPSISWTGGATSTSLGSTSFDVNLPSGQSTSLTLKTSWYFGGTYSGTYIDTVQSSGTVYLSR